MSTQYPTISLARLLEMPSRDAEGYGKSKVIDLLPIKRSDEFYPDLVKSIRENGIHVPVMIVNGVFENGHHRVAAAQDLGITEIPYTDDGIVGWAEEWPNDEIPASWCWD